VLLAAFDHFVMTGTSAGEPNGYSILVTRPEWSGKPKETVMTTRSMPTKFTLLTATLAASMVLLSATDGAQAAYHDNPIVYHPVHGPGSSHNPIVIVVRDHRGSGFQGVVRDHRGLNGEPGGVAVSGGGNVVPQPTCHYYCGYGYGYGHGYGHGYGGGGHGGGFQGDVRDHRGQPTSGQPNPCLGNLC
jgi:hypothetical protein